MNRCFNVPIRGPKRDGALQNREDKITLEDQRFTETTSSRPEIQGQAESALINVQKYDNHSDIASLPPTILDLIFNFSNWRSLQNFAGASSHYRKQIISYKSRETARLLRAEQSNRASNPCRLPCYNCLQILRRCFFDHLGLSRRYPMVAPSHSSRKDSSANCFSTLSNNSPERLPISRP